MDSHYHHVGPVIKQFLERHPAFSANPVGDWKELVGEQISRYSQPVSLKNGRLTVVVYDSIWKHHLELLKGELIKKINRNLPVVKEIVLKVGPVAEQVPELNPNHRLLSNIHPRKRRRRRKIATCRPRPLTDEEKALLQSLSDPELRDLASRLLRKIPD